MTIPKSGYSKVRIDEPARPTHTRTMNFRTTLTALAASIALMAIAPGTAFAQCADPADPVYAMMTPALQAVVEANCQAAKDRWAAEQEWQRQQEVKRTQAEAQQEAEEDAAAQLEAEQQAERERKSIEAYDRRERAYNARERANVLRRDKWLGCGDGTRIKTRVRTFNDHRTSRCKLAKRLATEWQNRWEGHEELRYVRDGNEIRTIVVLVRGDTERVRISIGTFRCQRGFSKVTCYRPASRKHKDTVRSTEYRHPVTVAF